MKRVISWEGKRKIKGNERKIGRKGKKREKKSSNNKKEKY